MSYISSTGQHVSVNLDHHQVHKSWSIPHITEYVGTQWDPNGFFIISEMTTTL